MFVVQLCFVCCPSDSTLSDDAGIEPENISTLAWHSDAPTTRLELIQVNILYHSAWVDSDPQLSRSCEQPLRHAQLWQTNNAPPRPSPSAKPAKTPIRTSLLSLGLCVCDPGGILSRTAKSLSSQNIKHLCKFRQDRLQPRGKGWKNPKNEISGWCKIGTGHGMEIKIKK